METKQLPSVRKNLILNILLSVSSILFPLISYPYVFRVLQPEGIGKVALATSVIAYFSMFAQLGIPTYGIRACAKVRDDRQALSRTVHELLGINLVMDGITYALLAGAILLIPKLREERLLYMIISITILLNSIGMEWLYHALEKYMYMTIRSIVFKTIALGALFLLVKQKEDYVIYGAISIFAASASNIMNFFYARKSVDVRIVGKMDWKRHLKPVAIFFALACAATIYTNLDSVMLGFMTTDADVGYYNAAVKVKSLLVNVVTALGAVLLPRSSWYVEHGQMGDFRRMTVKALRFILLVATALSVYFMLYAKECILFLSGDTFLPAEPAMQIIMPTVLMIGLTNILGIQILVPLGKEKVVLKSEIAGAIVDLILNLILIPRYRAAGAAIGTLAAETMVFFVQYLELRGEIGTLFRNYRWMRLAAGLTIAAAAGIWVKYTGMKPVMTLIISAICFFTAYGGFMLWQKEETMTESIELVRRKIRK